MLGLPGVLGVPFLLVLVAGVGMAGWRKFSLSSATVLEELEVSMWVARLLRGLLEAAAALL